LFRWPLVAILPESAEDRIGLMEAGESQAVTWTVGRPDVETLTFNPPGNGVEESLLFQTEVCLLLAISAVASSPKIQFLIKIFKIEQLFLTIPVEVGGDVSKFCC